MPKHFRSDSLAGRHARALIGDPGGRWAAGEVGVIEEHGTIDYKDYEVLVNFGVERVAEDEKPWPSFPSAIKRDYYFSPGEWEPVQ